jgi:hypothetical protein
MAQVSGRVEEQLRPDEEVEIAAVTASELLHGVHRASPEQRLRTRPCLFVGMASVSSSSICADRRGAALLDVTVPGYS